MTALRLISFEFLLWSQWLLLWSVSAYGVMADPLSGETPRLPWTHWTLLLTGRAILASALTYGISGSMALAGLLFLITGVQPLLRYRLPMRWLAEYEGLGILASLALSLALIRRFHLVSKWVPAFVSPAQLAALCILASTLFLVVRGGTYMVRGVLTKSGTLTSKKRIRLIQEPPASAPASSRTAGSVPVEIAAAGEEPPGMTIDVEEYNRGRLIGNLERIVLTLVVAAGSYAALAFLVAAKGVVRSEEFEKSRDFTEYFLIGSLSSVLVALCAGMALRFALIRLWPDLLSLQMQ
jgi:hypothetical protein